MKYILLLISFVLVIQVEGYAQFRSNKISVTGSPEKYPSEGGGLEAIYVFRTLSGASISYIASSSNTMKIYTYETHIDVNTSVPSSNIIVTSLSASEVMYTVTNLQDSRGLVFEDNNQVKAVWIIDYNLHKPRLSQIRVDESEDKCEALKLSIVKDDKLEYRTTGGLLKEVKRLYNIRYDVDKWEENEFVSEKVELKALNIGTEIIINKSEGGILPNKKTKFSLIGDQFGIAFGNFEEIESEYYMAAAVEAHMVVEQHNRDSDNEEGREALGGSAPVEIDFYGKASESADHFAWYIFDKKDTKNPIVRYNDRDMNYTFETGGKYEVRFEAANRLSGCIDTTNISLEIWESDLKPMSNFLSPGNTLGQPTEFKFIYKSIIKFRCTIFNRWGNKVYEWTDPAQGWDGKYKGRYVNTGVYYYVVEATGSEGNRYKEAGDINVLR